MASDLHLRVASTVRRVNYATRQPEHALFDLSQNVQVRSVHDPSLVYTTQLHEADIQLLCQGNGAREATTSVDADVGRKSRRREGA